jgi:hypothetical protein
MEDATTKRSQCSNDKVVARPVKSAIDTNGSHHGKSRLGSIITGHQQSAAPATVRTTKSEFLGMYVAQGLLDLLSAALADLDVEALDLLVEGGQRDVELLCGVGLIPIAALEFLDDDAALDVFEDVEE